MPSMYKALGVIASMKVQLCIAHGRHACVNNISRMHLHMHARAQNNYLRPACHYDRPQHKMTDPGLVLPAILQRSK